MSPSARTVAVAFVVGLLLGGGAVAAVLPTETATGPQSSTMTATGCTADAPAGPSSYFVRLPDGERTTFLFNRTFPHDDPSLGYRATVETPDPDVYVLRVEAVPDTAEKPTPEDCTPVTSLDAVASVPSDYEAFRVVFDGETMVAVENDGSNVVFRRLENGTA